MNKQRTTIYLVRHGETQFNVLGKATGQIDCPITDRGVKQAEGLLPCLNLLSEEVDFDVAIHSGLLRAQQTCEILNSQLNLPVFAMNVFQEIHYGNWQGMLFEEVQRIRSDFSYSPPGGEPYRFFEKRVSVGLVTVSESFSTPLIVCHGGVIEAIFGRHQMRIPQVENSILYSLEGDFKEGDPSEFVFKKLSCKNGVLVSDTIEPLVTRGNVFY